MRSLCRLPALHVLCVCVGAVCAVRFFQVGECSVWLLWGALGLFLCACLRVFRAFSASLVYGALFLLLFFYVVFRQEYVFPGAAGEGERVFGYSGQVVGYPVLRVVNSRFVDCQEELVDSFRRQEYLLELSSLGEEGRVGVGRVLVKSRRVLRDLRMGDFLSVEARIYPVSEIKECGEFRYARYLYDKGVRYVSYPHEKTAIRVRQEKLVWIHERVLALRSFILSAYEESLQKVSVNFLRALIFGEKEFLSHEHVSRLQRAGLMHILAVSGLHVGFVGSVCFVVFFMLCRVSRVWALMLTCVGVGAYVAMLGYKESVVRAFLMFMSGVCVYVWDRDRNMLNALSLAGLVILLYRPSSLFLPSFQLSFLATLGIVLFFPALRALYLEKLGGVGGSLLWRVCRGVLERVCGVCGITVSAQVLIIPLLVVYFKGLSVVGVFSNVAVTGLLWVCVALAFLLPVAGLLDAQYFVAWSVDALVEVILRCVALFADLPFAYVELSGWWAFGFLCVYLLGLGCLVCKKSFCCVFT